MAVIPEPTLTRLLGSIEANNLVLLCGAGLSIPTPSGLLSAVEVARRCYDAYLPVQELPASLREDVAGLAGHFYATGEFNSLFLKKLIPWNELVGEPNAGHNCVGDLLASRAASSALSTNVDVMIEQWVKAHKIALRGAVEADEVAPFTDVSAPLLKLHGCIDRTREETLWALEQLAEDDVKERLTAWANWIHLNLQGKNLLIVGFWTDWGYLNSAINGVLTGHGLASITVVDPLTAAELQARAPDLWATLNTAGIFEHVQASSETALNELRLAFSRVWLKKFLRLGKPSIDASRGGCAAAALEPPDGLMSDLYNMRRDAEGVPYHRAATSREPAAASAQAAYTHLLFARSGALRQGAWIDSGGQTVRVVNGAGQLLSTVRDRYVEPPAVTQPDVVVCAGALDVGVPGRVIATGHGASMVRPTPGGAVRWITLDTAVAEFHL
jgi:hypothetical protein